MRTISSYMNKINICENDNIKVLNNNYLVNEDGYLVDEDGEVDIYATSLVLFGIEDFTNNIGSINKDDLACLEVLKSLGFKYIISTEVAGKEEFYATNYSRKRLKKELDKMYKTKSFVISPVYVKKNGKQPLYSIPFMKKEVNSLGHELVSGQLYSINFLIKRYKKLFN